MRVSFVLFVLVGAFVRTISLSKLSFQPYGIDNIRNDYGGDLATAIYEFLAGFPLNEITLCFDNSVDTNFFDYLVRVLQRGHISTMTFNLSDPDAKENYFHLVVTQTEQYLPLTSLIFGKHRLFEYLLIEIDGRNLIRRNIDYIFYWGNAPFTRYFVTNIQYSLKVFAITNPRNDTYRLYYSRTTSNREHHLAIVNWWNQNKGIFHHPTLPITKSVYGNFKGRLLKIPVLHKPPWHFVNYSNVSTTNASDSAINKTIQVIGGRDDCILKLLAEKLNFRLKYFDPPERVQGTSDLDNSYFNGIIGLISRREADLYIGDVAITYERYNFVEFSFITLADSGAFITHAPNQLNEALALLRPFHWQVWPVIGFTVILFGPVLYLLIALPNFWRPKFAVRSYSQLFLDCTWFAVTIVLKQTGKEPKSNFKTKCFVVLMSFSATYVISDVYSANLTSLLARPGREKPIHDLYQLENAMLSRGYKLFIENHSSSHGLLENGTGIYSRLYNLIQRQGYNNSIVNSVEEGVELVKSSDNVALMAGRETLNFDIQRFGVSNFHLSEKLNTAYSAIALQLGCPFIEEINKILMAIFEAGIITKMTEKEFEKLGKEKAVSSAEIAETVAKDTNKDLKGQIKLKEPRKLKPISLKMLQGAFYLICFGNAFSGIILLGEIAYKRHQVRQREKNRRLAIGKWKNAVKVNLRRVQNIVLRLHTNPVHDELITPFDYLD